jgi:predicted nucleic acid-binding protein
VKAVFDTNVLVDHLNGVLLAKEELSRFDDRLISIVSWMEVMVGAETPSEERVIRGFLQEFRVVSIEPPVAERAVAIRQASRMKLPDAIIYATAQHEGCMLVTRNTRDFHEKLPDVRIPYRI